MPGGLEVTVPPPVPSRVTERRGRVPAPTVSVALPLRPPEVAVIVVEPGFRLVATPSAVIVATVVLLLVHVMPSETVVTGVYASSPGWLRSSPSPSRPKRPRPQHCTLPPGRSAQECSAPDVAAVAVVIPVTGVGLKPGVGGRAVWLPSPI